MKKTASFVVSAVSLLIIVLLIFLGLYLYRYIDNNIIAELAQIESEKAKVSNLHICSDTANVSNSTSRLIFSKSEKIYVCGDLEAVERLALTIYWIDMADGTVIYENSDDGLYNSGDFYSELKKEIAVGEYKVDVYYHRVFLGTVSFVINE